jgi:hypothetical protein
VVNAMEAAAFSDNITFSAWALPALLSGIGASGAQVGITVQFGERVDRRRVRSAQKRRAARLKGENGLQRSEQPGRHDGSGGDHSTTRLRRSGYWDQHGFLCQRSDRRRRVDALAASDEP